jgi:hypothetical protein
MNLNEREEKIKDIRTLFLEAGYGRFKLLKEVFTPEELLHTDPLVLIKLTYRRLSLEKDDFNEASFRRWLRRNRNKQNKKNSQQVLGVIQEQPSGNFQFTDPATLAKSKEPLIKFA